MAAGGTYVRCAGIEPNDSYEDNNLLLIAN